MFFCNLFWHFLLLFFFLIGDLPWHKISSIQQYKKSGTPMIIIQILTWHKNIVYKFCIICKSILYVNFFLCSRGEESGGGAYWFTPVHPSVRPSGYRYMVCPAISYSFGATALIFCTMFILIMEVCMSTGFWFSSNIW